MGILSEIDMMNRDAEDDAFEVSSDSETVDSFSEEFEPVETPKQETQAEDAEEARKKAEFDAAEAKRKADWEAKQAQKKLREQQELDQLAAMSDDDVMQASMNRVSQDTERLTRRNMKLCVMEDVQTECLADPCLCPPCDEPQEEDAELLPLHQPQGAGVSGTGNEGQRRKAYGRRFRRRCAGRALLPVGAGVFPRCRCQGGL